MINPWCHVYNFSTFEITTADGLFQGKIREFNNFTREPWKSQGIFGRGTLYWKIRSAFHMESIEMVVSVHIFLKN